MTRETMVLERAVGADGEADLAGAALTGALASVEEVRAYLGLGESEGDDGLIMDCIHEASEWIERVTGRCFVARDCVEFVHVGAGEGRFRVGCLPVMGGVRVHGGPRRGLEVRRVHDALEATVSTTAAGVVLRWVDALGGEREVRVGFENGCSLRDVAREISCVAGWSASAMSGCGAEMLIPGQVVDAQCAWGAQLMACTREVGCRVVGEEVLLERVVRGPGVMRVSYRAGYEVVPEEVRGLCVRMAGRGVEGGRK